MAKAKSSGMGTAMKVGAGVAIAAAAIAGAYLLYGKDGAKNRKKVRSWGLKMKAEILEKMEQMPELSEAVYTKTIDEVSKHYKALKNIDPKELQQMVSEMKGHWASIKKQITPKAKKVVKKATKTAQKVKTAVKKATKR